MCTSLLACANTVPGGSDGSKSRDWGRALETGSPGISPWVSGGCRARVLGSPPPTPPQDGAERRRLHFTGSSGFRMNAAALQVRARGSNPVSAENALLHALPLRREIDLGLSAHTPALSEFPPRGLLSSGSCWAVE